MYLDLLKRCLLNEIYLDDELRLIYLRDCLRGGESFDYGVYHDIRTARADRYKALSEARQIGRFLDRDIHNSGFSHTMIGRKRLDGLHRCLDLVRKKAVPGDLMECGVWRGGACIFMAGYLKNHGMAGRKIIVADSFDGVPESTLLQDKGLSLDKSRYPELAVSLDEVKANFKAYGLLDETVHFLKGWFKDTLQDTPSRHLALLRLDGDLYESTMDALTALYDRVVPGGVVIIDDWGVLPACRGAVEDFFSSRNEDLPDMIPMDWSGVYFFKPSGPNSAEPVARTFETAFPSGFLNDYQEGSLRYTYRDVRCIKSPIDMAVYYKAIWDLKPKTIIEIGTHSGGGALLLADLAQIYGLDAHIYTIDLKPPDTFSDPRITFVKGDVMNLEAAFESHGLTNAPHPWFITEDSAHTFDGCSAALKFLARHMTSGDLLVMEDGVLDELGLSERYDGGPNRAIAAFQADNPGIYEIATELCDMFGPNATYAPNGYLRKT